MRRRDFLVTLPLLLGARPGLAGARSIGVARGPDAAGSEATKGLRFGLLEAKRTLQLRGRSLEWVERDGPAAATSLAHSGVELLVVAGNAGVVPAGGAPVVRVPLTDDDRSTCGGEEWLVGPAPEQRAAVIATYRAAHAASPAELAVAAWHPALERYGAQQLNERYRAFAREPMTEYAWLGWIAIRVVLEAALRGPAAAQLRLKTFGVDGHKGTVLRFDPYGRRLQQPLYVCDARKPASPPLAEITPDPVTAACTIEGLSPR